MDFQHVFSSARPGVRIPPWGVREPIGVAIPMGVAMPIGVCIPLVLRL